MPALTARRTFTILFVIALFTIAVRETLDPDMWWHLKTGQVILQAGIPQQDIFSFTVPGNEWITHEWLAQVFMWQTYASASLVGLMLAFAVITAVTFGLTYVTCNGRPYLAAFIVLLAAFVSAPVWGIRPQMFNLLLTAAFIFLIEGYKEGKFGPRTLWLLPLLTVLWANLHSGYLLGIVVLGVYVAGESIQLLLGKSEWRSLDWKGIRWLALLTLLSFIVAVLNPNGPDIWIYPFFTLGSSAMQQYIQEWQSPDFHMFIFWPFVVMLSLGVFSWLLGRQPPTWTDVLLFGGTAVAGLLSARHIPLFALVAAPIIARYSLRASIGTRLYPLLSGQIAGKDTSRLRLINVIIIILAFSAAAYWIGLKVQANDSAVASRYPVAAIDYLQQSGLDQAKGFNSYNWGGYMIWRGLPVFVDGRADVYGDDFLHRYRQTFDLSSQWSEPLDEFDVRYVIMERSSSLTTLLASNEHWRQAYMDHVATVFVRDSE